MAGAARRAPAVIGTAGVGVDQVAAAHGKHQTSTVAALEEAGVGLSGEALIFPKFSSHFKTACVYFLFLQIPKTDF